MAYIYILHFDVPFSHAEHYAGCTESLRSRLAAHAKGAGSTLCRRLLEAGTQWRLGALGQCTKADMRRLERHLKDQHNSPRYCDICTDGLPARIPHTTPYDIALLPYPANSRQLAGTTAMTIEPESQHLLPVRVRFVEHDEPKSTMSYILDLMRNDRDALGFIPCGGEQGLTKLLQGGRIALATNNDVDVGYAAYTVSQDRTRTTIHQCCVEDAARLMGHGRDMVQAIRQTNPETTIWAKVKDDLAANHFWNAIGFTRKRSVRHKTSGNLINHYYLPPITIQPTNVPS